MSIAHMILQASFWILFLALLTTLLHLYRGPMILDRVNALNMFGNLIVGLFIVLALMYLDTLYLEISLVICLTGFIPIAAMSHYLLRKYKK